MLDHHGGVAGQRDIAGGAGRSWAGSGDEIGLFGHQWLTCTPVNDLFLGAAQKLADRNLSNSGLWMERMLHPQGRLFWKEFAGAALSVIGCAMTNSALLLR